MSAQTRYGYSTPMGAAGGIVDLAPYVIDTRLNEEEAGVIKFGLGVVCGEKAGTTIKKPTQDSDVFEGVTVNNRTTEYDLGGKIHIRKGAAIGVMRYGRVYGLLAKDVKPKYGDSVYVVATGEEAGYFTTEKSGNIAVKGRFLSETDKNVNVAMIELFNQATI